MTLQEWLRGRSSISAPLVGRRWRIRLAGLLAIVCMVGAAAGPAIRDYYTIENVGLPGGIDPQVGGMGFLPDGRLAVCLHRGEVMIHDPAAKSWRTFARGLHEPLGLIAVSAREFLVMQRPELTRLLDTDGDGTADRHETVWDDFGLTGNYHEYAYGPVRDAHGDLFVALNLASTGDGVRAEIRGPWSPAGPSHDDFLERWAPTKSRIWKMYSRVPWRGWIMKLDGRTFEPTPWSCGFRSPDGLGFDAEGRLCVTDNQGDWVGTSCLFVTARNAFHGHPISLVWKDGWSGDPMARTPQEFDAMRSRPAVLFPHGLMANSPTQPICDTTGGRFGPFAGQLIVGEMNTPRLIRVMLDEVAGQMQGACVPFIDGGGLRSGNHRLAFAPDGSLWVGQTHLAWAGGEGIQRLSWTGRLPMEVLNVDIEPDGFLFTFTHLLDPTSIPPPSEWVIRHYHYKYHSEYGSPQQDVTPITPSGVTVRSGGRHLWCGLSGLRGPGRVYEFTLPALRAADGTILGNRLLCYTVNAVPRSGGTAR